MKTDKKYVLVLSFFVISFFVVFLVGMKFSKDNENFPLSLSSKENTVNLTFKNNKMASIYEIIVKDEKSNIVYNDKTSNNELKLDFDIEYGNTYSVSVKAYDENGQVISESENKSITWDKVTFDKTTDYESNTEKNYTLKINGTISSNIKIYYYIEKEKIYEETVNNNVVNFPKVLFNHKNELIKAVLVVNNEVLDKLNIKIDNKIIDDIIIDSPIDNNEYNYDDIMIKISGGRGATKFVASIYEEEDLIMTKTFNGNSMNISKNYLSEDVLYKLIVVGTYNDNPSISTSSDSSFRIIAKDSVKPVYVNKDKYVDLATGVTLLTRTKSATIIYTLDGTTPSLSNGLVFKEPILINDDTTIKAVAINGDNIESTLNTFEFIPIKKNITIYVSPSNQIRNKGVTEAGYSIEEVEMNKLADILVPKLKAEGYIVYRNNPKTDINTWASESKKVEADLHLALHSNGSVLHDESGVKTYIDEENNKTYSLANLIQDALVSVYYDKSNKNSVISYARGRLGEVRPTLVPFGILLEIGYHDDYNDAFWIVNNMNNIADAIVGALNIYYGY